MDASGQGAKWDGKNPHCIVNGKNMFKRIFIRNRQPNRTDWETWQKEIDESRKDGKN